MPSLAAIEVQTITGELKAMNQWHGQVILVVNVASQCGLTPQYQGLEELYNTYKERGFVVLGFPCNQFGNQEPGSDEEIAAFCSIDFKVSFPLFSKIDVNGDKTHPLFVHLKNEAPGFLGSKMIKWNFTKFLIDRSGVVVKRFAPTDTPASLASDIEALL